MLKLVISIIPALTLGSIMFILVILLLKQVKKNLSVKAKAKARRFAKT